MADPGASAGYAVVVPTAAIQAALRVPAWVRQRLDVDVHEVDDAGRVHPRQCARSASPARQLRPVLPLNQMPEPDLGSFGSETSPIG